MQTPNIYITPKKVLCSYRNVYVCLPCKPAMITGLSKPLRKEKPVFHVQLSEHFIMFIYSWKWGWVEEFLAISRFTC